MKRLARFRGRLHGTWVTYGIFRLNGFGRFDAALSILAHHRLGTKMYYYPKAVREKMEADREAALVAEAKRIAATSHPGVRPRPGLKDWMVI